MSFKVHLNIRSSWKLNNLLANRQIQNAFKNAGVQIFATKFVGTKPRSFIGSFIRPIPTMSNRTELEKAVSNALKDEGTMIKPEFELVRKKERVFCREKKETFVAEIWGINIQKEYAAEAVQAVQRLVNSEYPPLGLRGVKFVETPKESDPVRMICITEQNSEHYQTAIWFVTTSTQQTSLLRKDWKPTLTSWALVKATQPSICAH